VPDRALAQRVGGANMLESQYLEVKKRAVVMLIDGVRFPTPAPLIGIWVQ